jgi:hypothetical protein
MWKVQDRERPQLVLGVVLWLGFFLVLYACARHA